jgi:predicted amidohydrolase
MSDLLIAVALGVASGLLLIVSSRIVWVGWLMLVPLCTAVYVSAPLAAALGGAAFGLLSPASTYWGRYSFMPRFFLPFIAVMNGLICAAALGLAALLWPGGAPAWGVLIFPVATVVAFAIPESRAGRLANPLLVPLERWLPAVHVARLTHDVTVPALLALAAAVPVVLLAQVPPAAASIAAAVAAVAVIAGSLAFGLMSLRAAARRAATAPRIRVAAVSVDGDDLPGPMTGEAYRDIEGTVRRYDPYVNRAIAAGARVLVLPEVAVTVRREGRERWLAALARWAREGKVTVVAGMLDEDLPSNQLAIADEFGAIVAVYDKQHPVPGAEPPRYSTMPPALVGQDGVAVSAIICYDIDHNDLVAPVAQAGGVLAVPTNDWRNFTEIHHRAAVWEAVQTGVTVIRSAGHGMSSIYDPAGRVLGRASSFDGPVVLVADVPAPAAAQRAAQPRRIRDAAADEAIPAAERSSTAA